MLQYVFNKLPFRNGQVQQEETSSSGEDDGDTATEDDNSSYPQYSPASKSVNRVGLISKKFDATNLTETEEKEEEEDKEWVKSIGTITRLDESMPKGVIDRTYFFDISTFCVGNHRFQAQANVEFEAYKSQSCPSWVVTSMKLHLVKKEEPIVEAQRHKTLIVKVNHIDHEGIQVKWGDGKFLKIPIIPSILPKHKIMNGDWLKIHFEQISGGSSLNAEELSSSETLGKIVSVEPNRMKTIVGKITKKGNELCVQDEIYVTRDIIKSGRQPTIDALVRCVAVDSTQGYSQGEFQWRAVEISPSTYMVYNGDAHNRDEEGYFEEKEVSLRYRDMYDNRAGIKIKPEHYVKFQAAKIGTSVSKTITVQNMSNFSITFVNILFPHDNAICKFELDLSHREPNVIRTMAPEDVYTFNVICTPLQMGRTKEIGVFDFGDFKIARDFIITGLSPDEELLNKIKKPDDGFCHRPSYQRIRGAEQIGELIKDNNRTRIRGTAPIRAPFFIPTRIPRYLVPNEVWTAYKSKDEGIIKRHYGGALQILDFKNYSDKFKVSLWFEEVDNDIRRRQFDLQDVRFKRNGDSYSFIAPYIQDIQPPVLVGDPIDCFDPQEEQFVKYQGFIKKIFGTEVYVEFSEAFNNSYRGVPLTVRFCIGRMTYKRQHFAVDKALHNLGQTFLFPFGMSDIEVKEPRVPFFETEGTEDDDFNLTSTVNEVKTNETTTLEEEEIGLFKKSNKDFDPKGFKKLPMTGSKENKTNRRAQSMRTPFVSDCPTTKFLKDVRLRWFNKGLNEEQKNAVRRILRGQARPLPYIIFGPPGTGKTVTVVEAIIQVNRLDPNSRVLVTAPTNHAADVIAEQLLKSGKYHPGEFIRFNGFMRQEGVILEAIRDYCVDGEFLDSVARNRLIVATCATAGQFFSLNLTPGHFTHVFIDEAGYCTEPESMISAVNLDTSKGGQLILAGDPNQLGPVLMSDIAQNLDLNLSFLERLMKGRKEMSNVYARNQEKYGNENCGYNPLVLTKLIRNYRAHESLLKLPSRLFYDDDLISCASYEEAYALTQDPAVIENVLLTRGVPIVFHGVQGNSIRERDSPSWCNTAEIMQVVHYIRKLKQCGVENKDIGIITPYRKQAEKLRIAMQLGLLEDDTPKVGSVEEFQGGERQVVIISTVRSLYEEKIDACVGKLGFIFNEKRFNVAITRAKSLMIIVGNPHVLFKDKRWNELLRYCLELNAYTGCNLPVELDEIANQVYTEHKRLEEQRLLPTLPPDVRTSTYNPDGLDEDDFVDAE